MTSESMPCSGCDAAARVEDSRRRWLGVPLRYMSVILTL